jgi:LacI family transcriptional regulator
MTDLRSPRRATITDVAEHANVSIATVSRVINKTAAVAPDTAERVYAAIADLDYIPHAAAQGLARRRTNMVGLLLPMIGGSYFSPMLRGIENAVSQNGMALLIFSMQTSSIQPHRFNLPLGEHNTDGLIVFTNSLGEADLARLHKRQLPMLLLHQTSPPGMNIPCVTVENKAGSRKLINHLIESHHYQTIAFLAGPDGNEDSHWREMGYREALAAHDIPFDPALVATGGFSEIEAQTAVEQWLLEGVEMDAIFAGDDDAAIGAITALRRAGRRIPQDIAVVGFDDLPLSRHLSPALTTVRAPIEQVGEEAVNQLVRLIRTGQAESLIMLPTQLIIRQSCGCS